MRTNAFIRNNKFCFFTDNKTYIDHCFIKFNTKTTPKNTNATSDQRFTCGESRCDIELRKTSELRYADSHKNQIILGAKRVNIKSINNHIHINKERKDHKIRDFSCQLYSFILCNKLLPKAGGITNNIANTCKAKDQIQTYSYPIVVGYKMDNSNITINVGAELKKNQTPYFQFERTVFQVKYKNLTDLKRRNLLAWYKV